MKRNYLLILLSLGIFFLAFSCKESVTVTEIPAEEEPPFNPFDTITYGNNGSGGVPVDSASFLGLHTYIFSQRCNQPACHDGTFEPDFRTVQSAYNSLVLHSITKNFETDELDYRVEPGDPSRSMMYRRITEHNPPNFEIMPSSGVPLPENQVALIENWITDGAKDIYGNDPVQTSLRPSSYGLVAYEIEGTDTVRVDLNRGESNIDPFYVSGGKDLEIWFGLLDYNEEGNFQFGFVLGYNKVGVANNPYGFNTAPQLQMEVFPLAPHMVNSVFSQDSGSNELPHFQKLSFNPADYGFVAGDHVFLRIFVQDSDHPDVSEIPLDESPLYMHSYFSFIIE